jgi:hypothetical protein
LRFWAEAAPTPAAAIAASAAPRFRNFRRLVPFKFLSPSPAFILPPETAN